MNKRKVIRVVLALVAGLIGWIMKEQGLLQGDRNASPSERSGGVILPTGGISQGDFTPVARSGQGWELLRKCRLVTGRNGDGDSFHVRHEKGETEFRLYFVDTPESQYKEYRGGESNGKRIAEQGQYFGGLSQSKTTSVGQSAKLLVKKILSGQDFEILTKWEDVYGPDRKYCLVIVEWEGKPIYLHELLVAQGLGRIHTRGADLPKGRGWRQQKTYLETLENSARSQKLGAWGLN